MGGGGMNDRSRDDDEARLNAITERIIAGAFAVGNALGPGSLEKVYENALMHELEKIGAGRGAAGPDGSAI